MHAFGLTGGIASGKSSVAQLFRQRGVAVVDADQLAREVVNPGSEGLEEVRKAFGDHVLDESGGLDRKAIGAIVFGSAEKRRVLNSILHPRIAALGLARMQELAARGEVLACYEAALLVENGLADAFRPLVVVAAHPSVQLARLMARDGLSEDDAKARLAAQMPLDAKTAVADIVIWNDGDRATLERNANEALASVCDRLSISRQTFGLAEPT